MTMNTVNLPKTRKTSGRFIALLAMLVIVIFIATGITLKDKEQVRADEPTFYFSTSSSCASLVPYVTTPSDSVNLYLCVNGLEGGAEGPGLLGAEVHVTYPSGIAQIERINCGAFDTCINLSEDGMIQLLAASGLPDEGGNPVTKKESLATISVKLLTSDSADFVFVTSQVINENKEVENRIGTGVTVKKGTSENCGNGVIDPGENCDGKNVGDAKCSSATGYPESTGKLSCTSGCAFDTTLCSSETTTKAAAPADPSNCGNGKVDSGEDCDGSDLFRQTCVSQGYSSGGTLSCDTNCKFDYIACVGGCTGNVCGNGAKQCGEECDDGNLRNNDGCDAACGIEEIVTPVCGNGSCETGENRTNCLRDCKPPCGDGKCEAGDCAVDCPPVVKKAAPPVVAPPVVGEGAGAAGAPGTTGTGAPSGDTGAGTGTTGTTTTTTTTRPAAGPDDASVQSAARTVAAQEQPLTTEYKIPTDLNTDQCKDLSNEIDSDGDGLSDRTECYLGTDSANSDTDSDGCWDGDEVNQFYTSPLDGEDCSIEAKTQENIIITDPQPGWVIPTVRVAGITPKDTKYLSAVVFNAEYSRLNVVINALNALTSGSTDAEIEMELKDLESAISALELFIATYPLYEYGDLTNGIVKSLTDKIGLVRGTQDLPRTYVNEKEQAVMDNFSASASWISANLLVEKSLGYTSTFSENAIGNTTAKGFKLEPDVTLNPNKLYDVVAIATLEDGTMKSSGAVRFSVDSTLAGKPIPRSLSGENIPAGALALGNIFINGVRAEDGEEIELSITDQKPTISGDSEYGAQVYAIWESIVLASSVISDSEQGAFDIQAPKNLETNTAHKITLYAVKADEKTGQNMRSENVDVYFRVNAVGFPWGIVLWSLGITLALVLVLIVLRKRTKKKEVPAELAVELKEAEQAYKGATPTIVQPVTSVVTQVYKPAEVVKPVQPAVETKAATPSEMNEYLENEVKKLKEELLEDDEEILEYARQKYEQAERKLKQAEERIMSHKEM